MNMYDAGGEPVGGLQLVWDGKRGRPHLQQSGCRVSLQALPQFVHLVQEENWVIDAHRLQPVDDASGHAPHVRASGGEKTKSLHYPLTQGSHV